MSHPINHHYLSVFYLRQWCNADGKVIRYYRPHKDVVASPIAPDHTGYEPGLYTLFGCPLEQAQMIEKEFMGPRIDTPASRALEILLGPGISKMTHEKRLAWTRFLIAMRYRDPYSVSEMGTQAGDLLKADDAYYQAHRKDADPPNVHEWLQNQHPRFLEDAAKLFLPFVVNSRKIGAHIVNMYWFVRDLSGSAVSLLTGDRPLITMYGLADARCIWAFPLSPRFLFVAVNDPQQPFLTTDVTDIANVVNARVVACAMKHVYGNSKAHLQFVEERLRR